MKLLQTADERLHVALAKLSSEPLPLKTAFKLKGISKIIKEEQAKYEDVRKEALKKHGLKNEDGSLKVDEKNNVQFSELGIKDFIKELAELSEVEIDIPTIKLSELGSINLSASDVGALDSILVED